MPPRKDPNRIEKVIVGTKAMPEEKERWQAIADRQGINLSRLLYKAMTIYEKQVAPVGNKSEKGAA